MPRYRVEARDAMGREWRTVLDAPDAGRAVAEVKRQGYHATSASRTTEDAHPPRLVHPGPPPPSRPVSAAPPPVTAPVPARPAPKPNVAPHGVAFRMWLYPQLAATLHAGQDPSVSIRQWADRLPQGKERMTLESMAGGLAKGVSLSDAMRGTGRFAEGDVGLVEAAEAGGFLPDAFRTLGERATEEKRWRRTVRNLTLLTMLSLPGLAVGWLGGRSLVSTWQQAERGDAPNLWAGIMPYLAFPLLPVLAVAAFVIWVGLRAWSSPGNTLRRHRLGARFGAVGRKAHTEALLSFSDALRRLSEAGLPVSECWRLAAGSVANRHLSAELAQVAPRAGESSPLAARMRMSALVPRQYADLVETGETTGTTPDALAEICRAERDVLEGHTKSVGFLALRAGLLVLVVTYGAGIAIFAWIYARELIPTILSGLESE